MIPQGLRGGRRARTPAARARVKSSDGATVAPRIGRKWSHGRAAAQGEDEAPRPPHDRGGRHARRRRRRAGRRRRHGRRGDIVGRREPAETRHRRPSAPHHEHLHLRRRPPPPPAGRAARRPESRDRGLEPDRPCAQAGRGGDRGPSFLQSPPGHRLPLDPAGAVQRLDRRPHRAGRLDHHPAVHQERLPAGRPAHVRHLLAQAARGGARLAAREALVQGQDPHQLPEHDLLRRGRVRHRDGGAHLLRHHGAAAHPASSGPAGRHHPEPHAVRPVLRPDGGPHASRRGAHRYGGPGHDLGGGCR